MSRWQSVSGSDLEERIALGRPLDELLPRVSAIYMWRRHLRAQGAVISSPAAFHAWVTAVLKVPIATLRKRELSHYAVLETLYLGGQGLSLEKESTLADLARNQKGRGYVAAFLQSLAESMPSVYVGEAHDLRNRIRNHLIGETGLKAVLSEDFSLGWPDLDLWYYELPAGADADRPKALRTLLETVATRLTLAPCVRRIG
jgi:hypothetical protein